MTENKMVGEHHRLKGHEFGQTPGDSEGQGNLQPMGSQKVRHDLLTEQQQSQNSNRTCLAPESMLLATVLHKQGLSDPGD